MKEKTKKKYEITPERLVKFEASKKYVRMCTKCFEDESNCNCGNSSFVNIDEAIYPTIKILNQKGYKTIECCSGHAGDVHFSPYIMFDKYYDFNVMPYTMYFETTFTDLELRIVEIKRGYMRLTEEQQLNLIKDANGLFLLWANELEEIK